MIPAYLWKATNAPGGYIRPLTSGGETTTAAAVAAKSYERWLTEDEQRPMLIVQSCDLEKNWSYEPTGHKAFDEQRRRSSGFGTGNVMSNVQTSFYIRPRSRVECNGYQFAPGALREADLKALKELASLGFDGARAVRGWIDEYVDKELILYAVHHQKAALGRSGRHDPVVHGWVLTDESHNLLRQMQTNPSEKSTAIMGNAIKQFTCHHVNPVDLLRIEDGEVKFVDDSVRDLLTPETLERADEAERRTADADRQRQR